MSLAGALAAPASAASTYPTGTYTYGSSISIPDSGSATPNPAVLTVSDNIPSTSSITLTLSNVSDTNISHVSVSLQSPNGSAAQILCDPASLPASGGTSNPQNVTVTFNSDGSGEPGCNGNQLSSLVGQGAQGDWQLQVSDDGTSGSGESGSIGGFSLAFTEAPAVLQQPTDQTVDSGSTATFTAAVSAIPAAAVQWQKSTDGTTFTDIPGATADTLSIANPTTGDSNTFYQAKYSNSAGTTTTDAAMLMVNETAPVVTKNPVNTVVAAGSDVTFSAAASGDPTPTVSWELSTDGGSTFNPIDGAASASYTVVKPTLADNRNLYRAVFTNDAGTTTSAAAQLTVTGRVPSVPRGVVAKQTALHQVTISWSTPSSAGSSAITDYSVGYAAGQMGNGEAVKPTEHTDVFTKLANGRYLFSVAAENAAGPSRRVFIPVTVTSPVSTPTLSASHARITAGSPITLDGSGPKNSTLTIQRAMPGHAFTTLKTVKTNAFGYYRTTLKPTHTATYRTVTPARRISKAHKVTVQVHVTMTAVRDALRKYTFSGKVAPSSKGQAVTVTAAKQGGSYRKYGTVHTDGKGHWALTVKFPSTGIWTIKATAAATASNAAGTVQLYGGVK